LTTKCSPAYTIVTTGRPSDTQPRVWRPSNP